MNLLRCPAQLHRWSIWMQKRNKSNKNSNAMNHGRYTQPTIQFWKNAGYLQYPPILRVQHHFDLPNAINVHKWGISPPIPTMVSQHSALEPAIKMGHSHCPKPSLGDESQSFCCPSKVVSRYCLIWRHRTWHGLSLSPEEFRNKTMFTSVETDWSEQNPNL